MEIQRQRTDLWTQSGRERVSRMEKVASTYTHYQIRWIVRQMAGEKLLIVSFFFFNFKLSGNLTIKK